MILPWGDGKSYRAESQVRKLNRKAGCNQFESRIVESGVSREKALRIEQGRVNSYSIAAQRAGVTKDGLLARPGEPIAPIGNQQPTAKM